MIHLDFRVNPRLLAFYTTVYGRADCSIPGTKAQEKDVEAFRERAWEIDSASFTLLRDGLQQDFFATSRPIEQAYKNVDAFLEQLQKEPLFAPVVRQTMEALSQVREEWEANYLQTFNIMTELTGLKLDREVRVYITHPRTRNGMNSGGNIFWTYRLDFPNYNTVYLWHEILHLFIPSADGRGAAEHAVIQLLADNELRVRLNGGSYPPLQGHKELLPLMIKLLPSWRLYLGQPHRNIETLVKLAQALQHDQLNSKPQ